MESKRNWRVENHRKMNISLVASHYIFEQAKEEIGNLKTWQLKLIHGTKRKNNEKSVKRA